MSDTFERRRARIYVAGPISSDPMTGVQRATAVSRDIFLDGMAPFVPHWDAFWFLGEGHWNAYLEFDLEFVSVCDAVFRLGGESRGADKEVEVARELGIPVFFEDGGLLNYRAMLDHFRELGLTGLRKGGDREHPA